jgi:molybdopterin-guanine dinucleotide biosynthesis protein A
MIDALYSELEQSPSKHLIIAAKHRNRNHPLHLCISTDLIKNLEEALLNKQHRVMKWMNDNGAIWLDFSEDLSLFENFNSLEDLALN